MSKEKIIINQLLITERIFCNTQTNILYAITHPSYLHSLNLFDTIVPQYITTYIMLIVWVNIFYQNRSQIICLSYLLFLF